MAMRPGRIEPGLERVRCVAEALGLTLGGGTSRFVLVAGTNGKGSTVAFLGAILEATGQRVGRYTSPHLMDVSERIQINSTCIGSGEFVSHGVDVLARAGECGIELTYFEVVTLIALLHFEAMAVDWAVLEVGLGGRLDATNIVEPALSIVTTIGMDHMDFLGHTLEEIAWEKGGITRPGTPLVTGLPDALHAASLRERGVPSTTWRIGKDFSVEMTEEGAAYRSVLGTRSGLRFALEGAHQAHNAGLAIAAAELLHPSVSSEELQTGLLAAMMPGRNEWVRREGRPDILLDGAHNVPAAEALRLTLEALPREARVVGVLASREGKEPSEFVRAAGRRVVSWFATTAPDTPRMLTGTEVARALKDRGMEASGDFEDPVQALRAAESSAESGDIILVTGSLFLIGALKRSGVLEAP